MNKIERKQIQQEIRKENKAHDAKVYDTTDKVLILLMIAYILSFILALGIIHHKIVSSVEESDGQLIYFNQE